ncbi:MAG: AraC family ligand binding domain-containing protein, partial [Bacteroidota bacterium]
MSQQPFFSAEAFQQSMKSVILEEWDANNPWEPTANAYQVIWIQAGKGYHKIDLTTYEVEGNCVSFISPTQMHLWEGEIQKGYRMTFSLDFLCAAGLSDQSLDELRLFGDPYPFIQLDEIQTEKLHQMVAWWQAEVQAPSSIQEAWIGT